MAMPIRDLAQESTDHGVHTVVLGPAIPREWAGGEVEGVRLRGGGLVDFQWDDEGVVKSAKLHGRTRPLRMVNGKGAVVGTHQ